MVSTGLADLAVQTQIEKRRLDAVDWRRTIRLSGIGLCVTGPLVIGWYGMLNVAAKRWQLTGVNEAVFKVVADQTLFAPTIIPVFFGANILSQGKSVSEVQEFLENNFWSTLKTNWSIWPIAQTINFSFVPFHHQVLFVNMVAFFWNTYLAYVANAKQEPAEIQETHPESG